MKIYLSSNHINGSSYSFFFVPSFFHFYPSAFSLQYDKQLAMCTPPSTSAPTSSMLVSSNMLTENASSESLKPSPLNPLRITSHRGGAVQRTRSKTDKKPRTRRKKDKSDVQKSHQTPGFDFGMSLPTIENVQNTPDPENYPAAAQRASTLANVLLTSGKAIKSKFNVVDALGNAETKGLGAAQIHISRATRNRTETVKAMMAQLYHWMERSMEAPEGPNAHAGVQGVYNPLQVIRNRAVRAKHHELAPVSFRSLPLAVNAFSSRNSPGNRHGKPWKLAWGIELGELMNDMSWRTSHWHELRKHNGDLWFPDTHPDIPRHGSSAHPETEKRASSGRMHDALFQEQSHGSSLDDINVNLIPIESTRPPRLLRSNLKSKAKMLYATSTGAILASDSDVADSSEAHSRSFDNLSKVKIGRLVRRNSPGKDDAGESYGDVVDVQILRPPSPSRGVSSSSLEPDLPQLPKIVINNDESSSVSSRNVEMREIFEDIKEVPMHLEDVAFRPLPDRTEEEKTTTADDTVELSETTDLDVGPELVDIESQRVGTLGEKQTYLEKMVFLNYNFLTSVCPPSLDIITGSGDRILKQQFSQTLKDIVNVNDTHLPRYEDCYTGYVNESKSLLHMANNKYAVRIDNLLSATDRSIGEINTSLSMDLRKANETLDRLNVSLFGTPVLSEFKAQSHMFDSEANYKFLYMVLENTIVIVLRMIWMIVNMYKMVMCVVKLLWRILTVFC